MPDFKVDRAVMAETATAFRDTAQQVRSGNQSTQPADPMMFGIFLSPLAPIVTQAAAAASQGLLDGMAQAVDGVASQLDATREAYETTETQNLQLAASIARVLR